MSCHVNGGIGPFSLENPQTAQNYSFAMKAAVQSRTMPPWLPAENCGDFADSRRLTQTEIDLFANWHDQGAALGNPADAPPPLPGPPTLARVDQTLQAATAYTPAPPVGRSDDYRCFLLDPAQAANKDIIGFEVVPGVRAQVHHVILYEVDKANAQTKDANEAGEGWTCFGDSGVSGTQNMLGGWVPGTGVVNFPTGVGVQLTSGRVIAMQIHYNTSNGAIQPDQTQVKFMYATAAVTRGTFLPLADQNFSIPPMSTLFTPSNHPRTFPTIGRLWGVVPHMHTRGRKIKVQYTPTGGQPQCLVDIPEWDFHWQQFYFYKQPIQFGLTTSGLSLSCTWDNETTSPITWGENTSDEMCLNYVFVTQ
jgi:hypothetical protein